MVDQFIAFEKSLFKSNGNVKLHEVIYFSYIGRDKT